MAEPFLINPYRISRRGRRRVGTRRGRGGYPDAAAEYRAEKRSAKLEQRVPGWSRRRRKGGLPGRLLSRMMRTYGPARGMSEAWSAYRGGARRNDPDLGFFNPRRHRRYRRRRLNPFGEEVMIVGNNPRRRRRKTRARIRRRRVGGRRRRFSIRGLLGRIGLGRRRRRRRTLAANPRRRHYRRRRAMFFDDNPRRRRSYRRRFRDNPRRRRRGRGLAGVAALPAISFRNPMSLIMPAVVGTAAYVATEKIPSMVNVTTPLPRLGVKAAVGFGGGILISKFLGRSNGAVWAIGASINILSDVLRTYVFKTGTLLGMGAFPYQRAVRYSGYEGLAAYPQEAEGGYPM